MAGNGGLQIGGGDLITNFGFTMRTRGATSYQVGPDDHGRRARTKLSTKKSKARALEKDQGKPATRSVKQRVEEQRVEAAEADSMQVEESPEILATPVVQQPRTRSKKPTCLNYGSLRTLLYPDAFFCSNCVFIEDAKSSMTAGRISDDSRRLGCKAKHTNWMFPDDKREFLPLPMYSGKRDGFDSDDGVDDSDDGVNVDVVDNGELEAFDPLAGVVEHLDTGFGFERARTQELQECNQSRVAALLTTDEVVAVDVDVVDNGELEALDPLAGVVEHLDTGFGFERARTQELQECNQSRVAALLATDEVVAGLKRRVQELENKLQSYVRRENYASRVDQKRRMKRAVIIKDLVTDFCTRVSDMCTTTRATNKVLNTVVNAMFQPDFVDGAAMSAFLRKAKDVLRKTIFTPYNILREMDARGGVLSYEGLEIVRFVETKGVRYYRGSLIPCSADMKRAAAVVEYWAKDRLPYEVKQLDCGGELVAFTPDNVLEVAVHALGLAKDAPTRSLHISRCADGASLTKHIGHVLYGVKGNDKGARDPVTSIHSMGNTDEQVLQSRNFVFPLVMVIGKENKHLVNNYLKDYFDDTEACGTIRLPAKHGWKPMTMPINSDMSFTWKGLGRGGAAKVCLKPCQCCSILSEDLATKNFESCNWCYTLHGPDSTLPCYHGAMLTEDCMASMTEELSHLKETLDGMNGELVEIQRASRIRTKEDPRFAATAGTGRDNLSIHFDFNEASVKRAEKMEYANLIGADLTLRGLDAISGTLSERRERLRQHLVSEWSYTKLRDAMEHGTKGNDVALFLLIDAVPCILHLENRVGIKILTRLLTMGLGHALAGHTFLEVSATSQNKRMAAYFVEVNRIVNCEILGTASNPSQWDCPRDERKRELGPITMDNVKTRKIIDDIETLVYACIPPDNPDERPKLERGPWLRCIPPYREAIIILRQKTDYAEDDIATFQKKIDEFFHEWAELNGLEGLTNYIHMLASGHIAEYMRYWKNLYRNSQQGWEAFNSQFKTYFFRRTGHGGAGNKGTGEKSRLIPMARWLQRRMVWMSRVSVEEMEAFQKEGLSRGRAS
jgi:hypothetical protein